MVGELAQIGIGGRYLRIFLGIALILRGRLILLRRRHLLGQQLKVSPVELSAFREHPHIAAGLQLIVRKFLMKVPPCTVK